MGMGPWTRDENLGTGWLLVLLCISTGCPKGDPMDTAGPAGPTTVEHCGTITDAETWAADLRHLITCDVVVEGSLTMEPGVEVYAERGTALRIQGGQLYAVGTSDEALLLASAEAFPVAGDWVGLVAQDGVVELAFITVRHAGSEGALVQLDGGQASVSNVILSNSTLQGLYASETEFSVLEELEIAYVDEPLSIPWAAAAVLSGVYLDQVDGAAVRLLGDTLDVPVGLGPIDVPYLCEGVTVLDGANLWVEEGAMLATTGDITVDSGGAIVMRGSNTATAAILGWEGAEFVITIHRDATLADFRWASIAGGRVESDAAALSFRYSDISAAPGVALGITGGVDTTVFSQLSGNSFAGAGDGLVVPLGVLPYVGENDYSGASYDGVVVLGETVTGGVNLSTWPPANVLVRGELRIEGSPVNIIGPATLQFADGASLLLEATGLEVGSMTFTHQGESPGGWEGITIVGSGVAPVVHDCEIAYGGGWNGANVTLEAGATLRDNTLRHSAGWGVLIQQGVDATLLDNTYDANAQGDVGQGS